MGTRLDFRQTIVILAAVAGSWIAVCAQTVVAPSALTWVDDLRQSGIQSATLVGDPSKPGPYTRRIKLPPRTVLPPHWHPEDRQVTTLSGTWYVGHGTSNDHTRATKVVPGAFLVQPAKSVHYEFTGDEEVIVQLSGIGPTATEYVK